MIINKQDLGQYRLVNIETNQVNKSSCITLKDLIYDKAKEIEDRTAKGGGRIYRMCSKLIRGIIIKQNKNFQF